MGVLDEPLAEMNRYTDMLTAYTMQLRDRQREEYPDKIKELADIRKIPESEFIASDMFYIGKEAEMLIPDYFEFISDFGVISPTNKKPIFHDRWVLPIKDKDGRVLNLVGYNGNSDERYIYGTSRYYRRRQTPYGLENLGIAYDLGYALLTEGITDTLRVRSLGFKNCFANCGTHRSIATETYLNRCRYGVIDIPDRDAPGRKAHNRWEFNNRITVYIFIAYKDVDEMCKDNNSDIVSECLNAAIDELVSLRKQSGIKIKKEITIC